MKVFLLIFWGLFIILMSFGYFLFSVALKRQTSKNLVFNNKHKTESTITVPTWTDSFEKTTCISYDGITLSGYIRKNYQENPWIVFVHGYAGNLSNMIPYINHFVDKNYNILAVDLRGHGESEGKYYGLSYLDAYDINSWVEEIKNKWDASKVVLFGISMGGASCLRTAAKYNNDISAVISDSAPSNMKKVFLRILKHNFGILAKPLMLTVEVWLKMIAKFSFADTGLIKDIKNMCVPTLIVHGCDDGFVPVSMASDIFDCIGKYKEKLLIKKADHTKSVMVAPELYWERVDKFLSTYLESSK